MTTPERIAAYLDKKHESEQAYQAGDYETADRAGYLASIMRRNLKNQGVEV
jgi:hypothetical protein